MQNSSREKKQSQHFTSIIETEHMIFKRGFHVKSSSVER